MDKIVPVDSSYEAVIAYFSRERIQGRIEELLAKVHLFLDSIALDKTCLSVSDELVTHVVMDYFTDIKRLKDFHPIEHTNEYKILAYEIFWWLRRKPIQITKKCGEDSIFANEKFAISLVIDFFSDEVENISTQIGRDSVDSFYDTLYYYLKYRHYDAQSIEMILLAYKAGSYTYYRDAGLEKGAP